MAFLRRIPQHTCRVALLPFALANVSLALALVPLACREPSSATGHRVDAVSSAVAMRPEPSLFSQGALDAPLKELRQRVGTAASVLAIELTVDRATIQVEAPTRPGHVVQYEWDEGTLRGPIPVELRGTGVLKSNLFPLSAVELAELDELAEAAVQRVDKEHGKVERIVVRRNLPVDESVGIRVYVESPIRSSHVDADARGKIVEGARIP